MAIKTTKDGRTIRTGRDYADFRKSIHASQNGWCSACGAGTLILTADPLSYNAFHVHHWRGRGMGGGKRDDVAEAVTGLCGYCHRSIHGQE